MSSSTVLSLFSLFCYAYMAYASPAIIPFQDCFDEQDNIVNKLNISSVYAQVLNNNTDGGNYLNLTVFGNSPSEILGLTNTSSSLATLFTSTSVLTLNAWSNASYLCQNLRPPSPLPAMDTETFTFCPIAPGPFAFASTIPWGKNRQLTTLNTRLRAVDPFGKELLCLDIATTPLVPTLNSIYGKANIILWCTVALTIAYWAAVGIARITSAWNRGISRNGKSLWSRAQSAGFIIASAISGERLATSPALMRFCTPSMRDVIFHTQWCALLGMVAVEWPQFVYPLLTQTAWSTLSYNISLTSTSKLHHHNPLATLLFEPPSNFADQVNDPSSPLYINSSIPNTLFTLPSNTTNGLVSFAYTLGIRPQDLFPTCLILFLSIIGVVIVVSILVYFIDAAVSSIIGLISGAYASHGVGYGASRGKLARTRSPVFGAQAKNANGLAAESPPLSTSVDENRPLTMNTHPLSSDNDDTNALSDRDRGLVSGSSGGQHHHRAFWWFRLRSDIGSFHSSVLHGNLVRILVLFHLPITTFSSYQMTLSRSQASTTSITLAALSFVIISVLLPLHLVIRVTFTTTNKLYDETRTLLSLGPLYNHYRHGSQLFASLLFATNIAFGVTIGAGQKSGTAQAIVILVVEVGSALVTSIWLPWGSGASMGLISFLFCVARIVVAVLLVILTPTISIGSGPGGWVAYGILVILALVYLALALMLIVKFIEAGVRIVGGIGFDKSKYVVDSGLIGTCSLLGCCGSRKRGKNSDKKRKGKGGDSTGRANSSNQYPATDVSESQLSVNALGRKMHPHQGHNGGVFNDLRRNSDLSSYNPPALNNNHFTDSDRSSTHTNPSTLPFAPATYATPPLGAQLHSTYSLLSPISAHPSLQPPYPSSTLTTATPVVPPRFLGGTESRKGSTHSQPPSVLRPEHANRPYREESDQDWWMEGEQEGGAFIMGAWQPAGTGAQQQQSGLSQSQQRQASSSVRLNQPQLKVGAGAPGMTPAQTPPTSGFSRVGGGRAHIDTPYAIVASSGGFSQQQQQSGGSTQTFPSIGQQGSSILASDAPPLQAYPQNLSNAIPVPLQPYPHPNLLPLSNSQPLSSHYSPHPPASYIPDEEELPLSTVRQAHATVLPLSPFSQTQEQVELGVLPPGAMQPAHIRTKSQTAIIEDAGLLNSPTGVMNGVGQQGARLQPLLIPPRTNNSGSGSESKMIKSAVQNSGFLHPPPSAPAIFTLDADDEDNDKDDDSAIGDQQQKKKWYQLRKKRPHSSEGRTTTTTTSASSSFVPLPLDTEFGGLSGNTEGSGATPQRSFVVIRKPVGSMGRLNEGNVTGVGSSGTGQGQVRSATSPRSRPPTR